MSTRTGIPTAATYVFVNMINKLRKDFAPQYLAAIYDVGAPVHRNELAGQLKDVQKFNIKTQAFETIEYGGYKANRTETPPDLIQQQPYIRRALEAFRIPILYYEGFEADDVIGTLSCKLAALGHHVYVVSSDKDMMQLVNEKVSILNPTKDNLILDPAGVEKILGVPPERVVDVMALRGDSIDNIPGAPGIGDKGSVELIQQFGSVESALDRAEEVKKKTYRESLQNNRENILLSKELVTIHTSVPIEYTLEAMRTQPVDNAACRELFSELEFTTLLKELAPAVDNTPIAYNLKPTQAEFEALLAEARKSREEGPGKREETTAPPQRVGFSLAIFEDARALAEETAAEPDPEAEVPEPPPAENMSLFGAQESSTPYSLLPTPSPQDPACRLALAVSDTAAIEVSLDTPGLREALEDSSLPKDLHDLKAVLRALEPHGVKLAGVRDDVMLLSYLVNPTHGSHTLPDVTARFTNRALTPVVKGTVSPTLLPESANAIHRVRPHPPPAGRVPHSKSNTTSPKTTPPSAEPSPKRCSSPTSRAVYSLLPTSYSLPPVLPSITTIDLPLVPVLLRMEQAGVRIDPTVLNDMSSRLAVEIDNLAERIYADSGHRFNINSPKQLGEILFNQMGLPKPMKYGKGKIVSTAQDVLEELAENHPIAALVIEHRQLQKLKGTYLDQLLLATRIDSEGRIHTTFNQVGTATGRLSVHQSQPPEHPHPDRHWPRDSRRLHRRTGTERRGQPPHVRGLQPDRAPADGPTSRRTPSCSNAYRTNQDIHTLTAAEVFGLDPATLDKETRAPRQGRQLRHRLWHQPLRSRSTA